MPEAVCPGLKHGSYPEGWTRVDMPLESPSAPTLAALSSFRGWERVTLAAAFGLARCSLLGEPREESGAS